MSVAHGPGLASTEFGCRLKLPKPRAGGVYEHAHLPVFGHGHSPTAARTLYSQVYSTDHACPDAATYRFGLAGAGVSTTGRSVLGLATSVWAPARPSDRVCWSDHLADGGDPKAVAEIGRRYPPLSVRPSRSGGGFGLSDRASPRRGLDHRSRTLWAT